jgi:hypothetical protein
MNRAAQLSEELAKAKITEFIKGRKCWYAFCTGSAFQMAFGQKLRRDRELKNQHHPLVYRQFEGESGLVVWCTWRIEGSQGPIASSESKERLCIDSIPKAIGRTVLAVEIGPGWNLRIEFSGGLVLTVFPDNVGPSHIIDSNWELWRPEDGYFIGTDLKCEVTGRDYPPLLPQPKPGRWKVSKAAKVLS